MASSARRIEVQFLGDAKGLTKTADQVERKTSSLGAKMAHVGKIAAVGLAGGLAAAGVAMVGMVKNGAEDLAAQRKLAVALQNTTGATKSQVAAVETWITKQGVALGVTDDELRPAFQRLVQATGNITQAQKLAGVAMDASAGSGKSLKTVSEAIAKAHNGNLGALSRLGIKIKDTNGKTLTFNQAMAEMGKTFKGQAAAGANTFDGKMSRLKLVFDETKETIGQKLIPILTDLATWFLNKGIPMLKKFGDGFSKVTDFIKEHRNTLIGLTTAMVALVAITKIHAAFMAVEAAGGMLKYLQATKLVSAATKVYAAVQWVLNAALTANPIGLIVAAIAGLVVGLVIAYKKSETFRNIVNGAFSAIGKAAGFLWNNVLKPTFKFIINAFLNVAGAIVNGAAHAFGWVPGIGPKLRKAADWFNDFKTKVNNQLDGIHDKKIKITTPGAGPAINNLEVIKRLIHDITTSMPKGGTGGPGSLASLLNGGRATGGPVAAGGAYLVGERGPEILKMGSQSGSIIPNHRIGAAGGQQTVTHVLDLRINGKTLRKMLLDEQRAVGYSFGIS